MPLRGLAQLLLLFPGLRAKRGWAVGAIAGGAIAGLILALPLPAPSELAQALRESAWDRALAEEKSAWPWTETWTESSAGTPVAATGKVPRLGLSAAVIRNAPGQSMLSPAAAGILRRDGAMPSELAVGDRIIVTTASGNSRAYRVAGPKVVDPHLAEDGAGAPSGDATAGTCVTLDPSLAGPLRLIIEAITADPPAPAPDEEQKL